MGWVYQTLFNSELYFSFYVTERVNKCEFGDLCDYSIKDVLIVGLKELRLTERILCEPDLTPNSSIQAC